MDRHRTLTSLADPAIKVHVTEVVSMTSWPHFRTAVQTNHRNRQDAREGGEIPPLPRNCERACFISRPVGTGCEQVFGQDSSAQRGNPQATEVERTVQPGKAAANSASQETGPRRTQLLSRSEGNEGALCRMSNFSAYRPSTWPA